MSGQIFPPQIIAVIYRYHMFLFYFISKAILINLKFRLYWSLLWKNNPTWNKIIPLPKQESNVTLFSHSPKVFIPGVHKSLCGSLEIRALSKAANLPWQTYKFSLYSSENWSMNIFCNLVVMGLLLLRFQGFLKLKSPNFCPW